MIPKFRAWDTFDEDMVNDIFFSWQDCGYDSLNECLSDERWKFMQYTGLFDKNGVEIFEGDVVSFEDTSDNENVFVNKGVVEICQLGWHFSNRVSVDMEDLLDGHVLDCEIIGNIYEGEKMTIKELYKIINSEKPKGMSLEKYMIKHPNRIHSRSTLILVARNTRRCLKQNRMPGDVVLKCLANYFNIYENPELTEHPDFREATND